MTYKVMVFKTMGEITGYVVTDQPDNYRREWPDRPYPCAAEFTVSLRHDRETQERRAYEYRDYLNKAIVIQPPIGTP
jgi:hypothetical protein